MLSVSLLKQFINKAGFSQRKFCEAVGMSENGFYAMVKRGSANVVTLEKFSVILKVPISKNYFQWHWQKGIDATKLKYTLYTFKHVGNFKMIKSGATIQDLKMQNRHQNTDHTWIYMKQLEKNAIEHIREHAPVI
jgi:hypothetical protein